MAFATTLEKHRDTLRKGWESPAKDTLDNRILRKAILRTEEEYSNDAQAEQFNNEGD